MALLSSPEFDPLNVDIDPKTLTFGVTGNELSLRRCNKSEVDFNGDGKPDLLCHFETAYMKFESDDDKGTVKGKTKDGIAFEGRGNLKVKPEKKDE